MLRSAGIEVASRPGPELWVCRPKPGARPDRLELDAATGRCGV
jgi:hypothetical protein